MTHHINKFYISGRKGSPACVTATVYDNGSILGSVEEDTATKRQLEMAMGKEYPSKTFSLSEEWGYIYAIYEVGNAQ